MELPVRILREAPEHPVIAVDGAFGTSGLHLSHWPGNATPAALRHDLSTGCALRFARLPDGERRALAAGASVIANNHYDTDGVCALFATRHPDRALPRAEKLLAAAAAGDFFRLPDWDALALDAIVEGLADPARSPLRSDFTGGDLQRWESAQAHLLAELPAILDGDRAPYRALFERALEATRADLADLARAARADDAALDLSVWSAPPRARSSRDGAPHTFDPGRHALFGTTEADRALVLAPGPDGPTCRLVVSTLSWFDLTTRPRRPRPNLEALAARLNELEGTAPEDPRAWRAEPRTHPSPELWFGLADHEAFAEHHAGLRPSGLEAERVRREVVGALRP